MKQLGAIIRFQRKEKGYTLKTLSEKIGISVMTLQRIETGQISPSVALMSQVARQLEKPISFFIRDRDADFTHIQPSDIVTYSDHGVDLKEVVPPRLIDDRMSVYLGRTGVGATFKPQLKDNLAFVYQMDGEMAFTIHDQTHPLRPGQGVHLDGAGQIAFNATVPGTFVFVVIRK